MPECRKHEAVCLNVANVLSFIFLLMLNPAAQSDSGTQIHLTNNKNMNLYTTQVVAIQSARVGKDATMGDETPMAAVTISINTLLCIYFLSWSLSDYILFHVAFLNEVGAV